MAPPKGWKAPSHVTKKVMEKKAEIDAALAAATVDPELQAKRDEAAKKFDAKMLARSYTEEAVKTLVDVMQNPRASDADRVSAAKAILERGHGRAPIMVEDGEGIKMPVVFLPVEMNEENKPVTVAVEAERITPRLPPAIKPAPAWYEEKDTDPTYER